MQIFGFSINLLTLFALVLAIGIVVDNAIVVVEAVHHNMHVYHLDAQKATYKALKEIGGAIFSITLVMSAVFIPVAFLSGPVGIFYRQFSITMAIAIVISGINALTLTPALCALILKPNTNTEGSKSKLNQFFSSFNRVYDRLTGRYVNLAQFVAKRKRLTIALTIGVLGTIVLLTKIVATGFIPIEDQGLIYLNMTTPPGSTVDRSQKSLDAFQKLVKDIPEIETISTLGGYSLITESSGASYGMGMINLKPWDDRERGINELITELNSRAEKIPDAKFDFFPPPTVPGFGNASGFELRLIDKTGSDNLNAIKTVLDTFITSINNSPEIKNAFTGFNPNFPQYIINVDQNLAAKNGVTIDNAMSTLQTLIGSFYTTNFLRFGQMYKVVLQASPEFRTSPESILKLYTKNNRGEMVPFSNFISLERVYGPEQLTRYNMFTSALINGEAKEGFSSGDAINAVTRIAKEVLPKGFTFEWTGITKEEVDSGGEASIIFLLVIVFVYLLLAAQYESLVLPIPVLLTVPSGVLGGLFFLWITGLEYNIYAQVAFIMLIGLLGKNAILIVEFAKMRVQSGIAPLEAAIEGAGSRFKPILMTSLAFIAGLIPLTVASGAGAIGNRSIGTAAAGGMLLGTIIGLILIPALFYLFSSKKKKQNQ
jgi:hydrophobe/amphiphile efflux-1 (HAE1) family protein